MCSGFLSWPSPSFFPMNQPKLVVLFVFPPGFAFKIKNGWSRVTLVVCFFLVPLVCLTNLWPNFGHSLVWGNVKGGRVARPCNSPRATQHKNTKNWFRPCFLSGAASSDVASTACSFQPIGLPKMWACWRSKRAITDLDDAKTVNEICMRIGRSLGCGYFLIWTCLGKNSARVG